VSLIERFDTAQAAAEACGARILALLTRAIQERGRATLAISGGSSPKLLFAFFAQSGFNWTPVHVFWVDERMVPIDHPESNYKLAYDTWLKDAGAAVHRVQTELAAEQAAAHYAVEMKPYLPFDVIHRGMGADVHTASLFPGDPLIYDMTNLVGVAHRPLAGPGATRVTLLTRVLESARFTAMLATGGDKAEALDLVMHGNHEPIQFPAQIAAMDPVTCTWFVDEPAAARI
jgi:6-phosphogluconolactonase